jgi:hypothetical protein
MGYQALESESFRPSFQGNPISTPSSKIQGDLVHLQFDDSANTMVPPMHQIPTLINMTVGATVEGIICMS